MRIERLRAGSRPGPELVGSILTRDIAVGAERWRKGRVLHAADLARVEAADAFEPPGEVSVLVREPDELHEDEAALRLAEAIAGPGLTRHGPLESRVDLRAAHDGVLRVRVAALERLNRLDPLEAFSAFDGGIVSSGDLVASVKVAPHLVPSSVVERAEAIGARSGPIVSVEAFRPHRIGVLVRERVRGAARERFERSVRDKIEQLGSRLTRIEYVDEDPRAVAAALRRLTTGRGHAQIVLTAGAASTDPLDPIFTALGEVGGRVVRRGVPAHPGSMLWLGRIGSIAVLGLPTCGAYSKATAVDLLLPRLLAGEPASAATIARLGHGGVLTRDQRFRFPRYARELEAPEG